MGYTREFTAYQTGSAPVPEGNHRQYRFPNDLGVSVYRHIRGAHAGKWEVGLIHWADGECKNLGELIDRPGEMLIFWHDSADTVADQMRTVKEQPGLTGIEVLIPVVIDGPSPTSDKAGGA